MLFAVIDFVRYRSHLGNYSDNILKLRHYKLATPENFSGNFEPPIGRYFVMHRRKSFVSWSIMYVTQSEANHVGMYIGNGEIVDALVKGVTRHPLSDYFDGQTFLVFDGTAMTIEQEEAIVSEATSRVGNRYSFLAAANIARREIFASPPLEEFNFRLYFDVLLVISFFWLPRIWDSHWPLFALWVEGAYLVFIIFRVIKYLVAGVPIRNRYHRWKNWVTKKQQGLDPPIPK